MRFAGLSFLLALLTQLVQAQYAPPAGQTGSDAIHRDSSIIISWTQNCKVTRGKQDIAISSSPLASVGDSSNAIGYADGMVVSLGDGGSALLEFNPPITNGIGPDFAVFENAFSDSFLELAFVDVSSDGINFFRFPAVSLTQTTNQVGSFDTLDATKIHNLAGKYRQFYGTPFDLSQIPENSLLNKSQVTHIKITDVIGTLNPTYASMDALGNYINDPYPTPFSSGGFDLDAVAVINSTINSIESNEHTFTISIYPNPAKDLLSIRSNSEFSIEMYDQKGVQTYSGRFSAGNTQINLQETPRGIYTARIISSNKTIIRKIAVQ